jgi:ankyrin repeat protein
VRVEGAIPSPTSGKFCFCGSMTFRVELYADDFDVWPVFVRFAGVVRCIGGVADGNTALMSAANKGRLPAVGALLLRWGANIAAADTNGKTALMAASDRNHNDVVDLIIQQGAAIHATDALGRTALRRAVRRQNFQAAAVLLLAGADFSAYRHRPFAVATLQLL